MIETHSLATLITAILQRMGDDIEPDNLPQIMVCICLKALEIKREKLCFFFWTCSFCVVQYEDEDNDKVILASDGDLVAAVEHAKSIDWKVT